MGGDGQRAAGLEIRPWRRGDDLELLQLWGDPEGPVQEQFRAAFGPPGEADPAFGRPWRRCLVGMDQGIAVAAAVVYESALHPQRLWAFVEVAKDHRRHGNGAMLLAVLRREARAAPSGVTALRSKVDQGSSGEAFARAVGFAPVQVSRLVRLAAGSLPLPRFSQDAGEIVEDLATGSVALTELVGRYYRSIHAWDPAPELTPGLVQRMFLAEAAGAHGALVLRTAGDQRSPISAFAVSYGPRADVGEDPPAEVFLGHDPDLSADRAKAAIRDLLALIAYQHPVLLEVDDSMLALRAVLAPLLDSGVATVVGPSSVIFVDGGNFGR